MARKIARAVAIEFQSDKLDLTDFARAAIVIGSAAALILAGPALPI